MSSSRLAAMSSALTSRVSRGIPPRGKAVGTRGTGSVSPIAGSKTSKALSKSGKLSSSRNVACLDDKLRRVANSDEGFAPLPRALQDRGPAVALAYTYLGDAVWEVYCRQHMILRKASENARAGTKNVALRPMEATKRGWCSSIAMHGHLMRLVEGDVLSPEELSILKWGKDFGHESRSGHKSEAHKEASALEALVAYWYLFDPERLHFVLDVLGVTVCSRPLRDLRKEAVSESAARAMDALRGGGEENEDPAEFEAASVEKKRFFSSDAAAVFSEGPEDTIESLRARVVALENELLRSKRATRMMRARK